MAHYHNRRLLKRLSQAGRLSAWQEVDIRKWCSRKGQRTALKWPKLLSNTFNINDSRYTHPKTLLKAKHMLAWSTTAVSKGSRLAPATDKFYGKSTESISKLLEEEKDAAADHNLHEEEISEDEEEESSDEEGGAGKK